MEQDTCWLYQSSCDCQLSIWYWTSLRKIRSPAGRRGFRRWPEAPANVCAGPSGWRAGLDVHILGGDVLHLLALVHEVARLRGGFEEARVVVLRDADGEGEGAARAGVRGFVAGFQIASGGAHGVGEGGAGGVKVLALDGEVGGVDELCARLRGLGAEVPVPPASRASCIGASTGLDGRLGCGKGAVHVVHRVGGVGAVSGAELRPRRPQAAG